MNRSVFLSVLLASALAACGKSEPGKPAATSAPAAAPATTQAPAATPAATPTPAAATAAIDGAAIYKKSCGLCHASGVAGAPRHGDKAQWAHRIAQGNDTLYTHAVQGFKGKAGVMPAKGGNTSLSDEQVKAAVDYMVATAR
jgi:cytochrome c5